MRKDRGFGCLFWLAIYMAVAIVSILIAEEIWNSDLPMWLKIWLLK